MTTLASQQSDVARLRFIEGMRVLVVAGVAAGVVLIGIGSRLAMLVLRVTSPDRVIGVRSDDDFTIGEVTLAGTYNLLLIGAAVGIIGAAVYRMVAPRLIGPKWFRRLTTGLAAAAVGGSMLVHADGIDFTMLKPAWLAVGLFVALPGIFGALVGSVVDAVDRTDSWTRRGRLRWLLPLIAIACFPPSLLVVAFVAGVYGAWVVVSAIDAVQRLREQAWFVLTVRSVWLFIAVAGLVALVDDTRALVAALD